MSRNARLARAKKGPAQNIAYNWLESLVGGFVSVCFVFYINYVPFEMASSAALPPTSMRLLGPILAVAVGGLWAQRKLAPWAMAVIFVGITVHVLRLARIGPEHPFVIYGVPALSLLVLFSILAAIGVIGHLMKRGDTDWRSRHWLRRSLLTVSALWGFSVVGVIVIGGSLSGISLSTAGFFIFFLLSVAIRPQQAAVPAFPAGSRVRRDEGHPSTRERPV